MFLALVHWVVLGAALRVEGSSVCPEPAQVAAELQKILEISDDYAPRLHATLSRDAAWLDLTLTGADGNSLGERRLKADEDCTVLIHTAAVVLAAWLSDEHPEFLVPLPAPSSAGAATAAGATTATPSSPTAKPDGAAPSPPVAKPAATEPAAANPEPTKSERPVSTEVASSTSLKHRLAISAALGGAWGSSEFAPGAWLGASLDPVTPGWGLQLSAAWTTARSEALAGGDVSWTRWPLLLGPYVRFNSKKTTFDLEGGAALGWLRLRGENFVPNFSSSHADFGGYAALRFMPSASSWHPFLMAVPVLWFGRSTAYVKASDGSTQETKLPSVDVLFTAGLRFLP